MKLAILQFFAWPERRADLAGLYERALARTEVMDREGYDAVWIAEHHFTTYSVCPSVHMMGLAVAARTKRLRIGTAISLAAFYHPLRLAEEVALLDVLSGGRVLWGAGRGFDPVEFKAFGVAPEESRARFQEAVAIVLAAWSSDRLDWAGHFWRFEDVEVLPKPQQRPHPPVWVAATSPPAITWAAENGHAILMDPHSHWRDVGDKRALYTRERAAHGHPPVDRELPLARLVAVARTDREAEEVARRGVGWVVGSYANLKNAVGISPSDVGAGAAVDPVERYLDGVAIHGTPERVADELRRLEAELGVDYVLCAPLSGASFDLLTAEVLPRFL